MGDSIYSLLQKIAIIVFVKTDGTQREMVCTQNLGMIPPQHHPNPVSERNETTDIIRVFDLQKNAWRSFYPSKVISARAFD